MTRAEVKRRKYIGVGGDDVPSLGVLEGEIMRMLWDAGESQSSAQVYDMMNTERRAQEREMQSPSTIAVTLSRMVDKGLLKIERKPGGGKGYYGPTQSRSNMVATLLDDVCRRLTGQPLGYLMDRVTAEVNGKYRTDSAYPEDQEYADLVSALVSLKKPAALKLI